MERGFAARECGHISYPQLAQMTPFEHIMIESLTSFFKAIPPSIKTDWDVGLPFTLSCTLHTASDRGREESTTIGAEQQVLPPPPSLLSWPAKETESQ